MPSTSQSAHGAAHRGTLHVAAAAAATSAPPHPGTLHGTPRDGSQGAPRQALRRRRPASARTASSASSSAPRGLVVRCTGGNAPPHHHHSAARSAPHTRPPPPPRRHSRPPRTRTRTRARTRTRTRPHTAAATRHTRTRARGGSGDSGVASHAVRRRNKQGCRPNTNTTGQVTRRGRHLRHRPVSAPTARHHPRRAVAQKAQKAQQRPRVRGVEVGGGGGGRDTVQQSGDTVAGDDAPVSAAMLFGQLFIEQRRELSEALGLTSPSPHGVHGTNTGSGTRRRAPARNHAHGRPQTAQPPTRHRTSEDLGVRGGVRPRSSMRHPTSRRPTRRGECCSAGGKDGVHVEGVGHGAHVVVAAAGYGDDCDDGLPPAAASGVGLGHDTRAASPHGMRTVPNVFSSAHSPRVYNDEGVASDSDNSGGRDAGDGVDGASTDSDDMYHRVAWPQVQPLRSGSDSCDDDGSWSGSDDGRGTEDKSGARRSGSGNDEDSAVGVGGRRGGGGGVRGDVQVERRVAGPMPGFSTRPSSPPPRRTASTTARAGRTGRRRRPHGTTTTPPRTNGADPSPPSPITTPQSNPPHGRRRQRARRCGRRNTHGSGNGTGTMRTTGTRNGGHSDNRAAGVAGHELHRAVGGGGGGGAFVQMSLTEVGLELRRRLWGWVKSEAGTEGIHDAVAELEDAVMEGGRYGWPGLHFSRRRAVARHCAVGLGTF